MAHSIYNLAVHFMSPVLADLVLEIAEKIALGMFLLDAPFFNVDDILTAVPSNKIDLAVRKNPQHVKTPVRQRKRSKRTY